MKLFLSYNRNDLIVSARIVEGLRERGYIVWWDQEIEPGHPWEATIEKQISLADRMIVLWSKSSTVSESVKAEARRGHAAGFLVQIIIDECQPPLFFGERQNIRLQQANGSISEDFWEKIANALENAAPVPDRSEALGSIAKEKISRIQQYFRKFETGSLFVGKNISEKRLAHARMGCSMPQSETIIAVIDHTTFRNASRCTAFTDHTFYHSYAGDHSIPYEEFVNCQIYSLEGPTLIERPLFPDRDCLIPHTGSHKDLASVLTGFQQLLRALGYGGGH